MIKTRKSSPFQERAIQAIRREGKDLSPLQWNQLEELAQRAQQVLTERLPDAADASADSGRVST